MVFQEIAAKVAIGFFSCVKILENTAFGHVTEVPIRRIEKWSKILCQINQESWKSWKIIVEVGKFFNQRAHSWWGFTEGVLQVALFTALCFKWPVKKHCVAKILQGI